MCKLLSVRPLAKIPFVGLLLCGCALGQAAPGASAPISPIAQRMDMVRRAGEQTDPTLELGQRLQVVAPYIKNGTVLFPRTGCE